MIYELIQKRRNGADAKPLTEFAAANDLEAWEKGMDAFDNLPTHNITLSYHVREKGTDREVNNPKWEAV